VASEAGFSSKTQVSLIMRIATMRWPPAGRLVSRLFQCALARVGLAPAGWPVAQGRPWQTHRRYQLNRLRAPRWLCIIPKVRRKVAQGCLPQNVPRNANTASRIPG